MSDLLSLTLELCVSTVFLFLFLIRIERKVDLTMAGLKDVKDALAVEHQDLAALSSLVPALLAAFANGGLSSADAQTLLDTINGDDVTVKDSITAIQNALPTPPASTV